MRIDTDRNRYYTNIIYPPLSSPSLALPNLAWPVLAEPILEARAACLSISLSRLGWVRRDED